MTDTTAEPANGRVTQRELYDGLREVQHDLLDEIKGLRGDLNKYVEAHAQEHVIERRKYESLESARLQAKGALGLVDSLGRNWQLIAIIVLGALAMTGQVHISFTGQ